MTYPSNPDWQSIREQAANYRATHIKQALLSVRKAGWCFAKELVMAGWSWESVEEKFGYVKPKLVIK